MQLERDAEGDQFKDKEAFVTQAYKDQMAEVRRAEEEEKRREGNSDLTRLSLDVCFRTTEKERRSFVRDGPLLSEIARGIGTEP